MNPEVLSLIKLAAVFAIIIGLLSMKKPLNLVMSIASVVVVVLYAMPSDLVLPALKSGLIGSNTINAPVLAFPISKLAFTSSVIVRSEILVSSFLDASKGTMVVKILFSPSCSSARRISG